MDSYLKDPGHDAEQHELIASRTIEAFASVAREAGPGLRARFQQALRDPAVRQLRSRADFQTLENSDSVQLLFLPEPGMVRTRFVPFRLVPGDRRNPKEPGVLRAPQNRQPIEIPPRQHASRSPPGPR